ncbi:MAG TPA: FitA-like ribbon-helix-helix domain-containing protein [Candidatus Wunengus sp. YC63]|uniref:FitA-like ribbon-helix-helix domain-containing protein n=1 Tax=Candidatus Wunengus sp. YC63 TaxID=3367699 RepID=UPI004027552F
MATMTIRGIDDEVAKLLKDRAKSEEISINGLVLKMVKESLGIEKKKRMKIYRDLDHLAGTWSEKELKEFQKHVEDMEKIDEEIWK